MTLTFGRSSKAVPGLASGKNTSCAQCSKKNLKSPVATFINGLSKTSISTCVTTAAEALFTIHVGA